eukprot:scaffold6.g2889.t1
MEEYAPPAWAAKIPQRPRQRYALALLPTPIHPWPVPGLPEGCELWIKRDDLTGMQLSGNKVRKLEFLMAEVKARGHDCVVTIGGIQSNHARATAVAARYLGLECHLLLRTSRLAVESDPGLTGNLLVERLVGAQIHQCTKEEYGQYGSVALGEWLAEQLRAQGRNPYVVPVGGSSPLGVWGYLELMGELQRQIQGQGFTDIAMARLDARRLRAWRGRAAACGAPVALPSRRSLRALALPPPMCAEDGCRSLLPHLQACGSGGTTAGIALGNHLSGLGLRVHAYGVCDTPEYFYSFVDGLLEGLGAGRAAVGAAAADMFRRGPPEWAVQARGAGYAISQADELATVRDVALATGIVLDPVYTGERALHAGSKAAHGLLAEIRADPGHWAGRKVLFVHTGGLLGMYEKTEQLAPLLEPAQRLHV